MPVGSKKVMKMALGIWESKTTPADLFKKHSTLGKCLAKFYVKRQFGKNGKEDKNLLDLLRRFFIEIFQMPNGSESALYMILKPGGAHMTLEDLIHEKLTLPIVCYYGDKDWMDASGAYRIQNNGKKDFSVKTISGSGHQVIMHNPKDLAESMLAEVVA